MYFNVFYLRPHDTRSRNSNHHHEQLMDLPSLRSSSGSRRLSSGSGGGGGGGGASASSSTMVVETMTTTTDSTVGHDECFVAGRGMTRYRLPTQTFSEANVDAPALVVGVLSRRLKDRTAVRQTWAVGHSNVFFLVAGNWTTQLEQEFQQHKDILYVEGPEAYREITTKVLVFLSAVNKYLPHATILKTDDDAYVRLAEMERIAKERNGQTLYMGASCDRIATVVRRRESDWYVSKEMYPDETFPRYALGGGYLLSSDANQCAMEQMQKLDHAQGVFPVEDALMGILLSKCPNVQCENSLRFRTASKDPIPKKYPADIKKNYIVHQIKQHDMMLQMHQEACCNTENKKRIKDPLSCAALSCPANYMAERISRPKKTNSEMYS